MSNTSQALTTPRVPRMVRVINAVVRRLIRVGLPFGPSELLTVRGRRTGLPRTFPVAVLEWNGRRYVQSPYGEVDWVRNLRADGKATLAKGRRHEPVEAVELSPEEAAPVLRDALAPLLRENRFGGMVAKYYDLPLDAGSGHYVEEARRHPMFELRTPAAA